MTIRLKYLIEDIDANGNVRIYFRRRPGRKVRIREAPGTPAFMVRYTALLKSGSAAGEGENAPVGRARPGTFKWLIEQYKRSQTFKSLDPETQRVRARILEHCCDEKVTPARPELFRDFPIHRLTTKALRVLRDRKSDFPEAANGRVKALRAVFRWALEDEIVDVNPARDLTQIKNPTDGFTKWDLADVEAFEARHPVGTKARLALALLLYTGMRKSDIAQLGRQHVRDGWISKPQHKGRNRHPHRIEIPMLEPLAEIIAASSTGDLTYLVTQRGAPFSIAGLGNWFRDRCDEAGLTGRSAHGLRKAGATRAAEAGATAHQLMAMFGWKSLAEAELYTRAADRKRLAREGMELILPRRKERQQNEKSPSPAISGTKVPKKISKSNA
jgi:integrase